MTEYSKKIHKINYNCFFKTIFQDWISTQFCCKCQRLNCYFPAEHWPINPTVSDNLNISFIFKTLNDNHGFCYPRGKLDIAFLVIIIWFFFSNSKKKLCQYIEKSPNILLNWVFFSSTRLLLRNTNQLIFCQVNATGKFFLEVIKTFLEIN